MVAAPKAARQSKVERNAKRENLYRPIFAKRNVPQGVSAINPPVDDESFSGKLARTRHAGKFSAAATDR
jgi:hypothetical protein